MFTQYPAKPAWLIGDLLDTVTEKAQNTCNSHNNRLERHGKPQPYNLIHLPILQKYWKSNKAV